MEKQVWKTAEQMDNIVCPGQVHLSSHLNILSAQRKLRKQVHDRELVSYQGEHIIVRDVLIFF